MAVPVHVIGGFLGTGKTTVVLNQLRARRGVERVAEVVNDFGEASIDAELVGDEAGALLSEIDGACFCCTAPAGFSSAIARLLEEVRPDRIWRARPSPRNYARCSTFSQIGKRTVVVVISWRKELSQLTFLRIFGKTLFLSETEIAAAMKFQITLEIM